MTRELAARTDDFLAPDGQNHGIVRTSFDLVVTVVVRPTPFVNEMSEFQNVRKEGLLWFNRFVHRLRNVQSDGKVRDEDVDGRFRRQLTHVAGVADMVNDEMICLWTAVDLESRNVFNQGFIVIDTL